MPTVGSRSVGLGPRCGLRAVARMRTGRALALGGAARSRTAHHNSDSQPRRSVRSTSGHNCGFSRRTARAALRAETSGGVLTRSPRACACAYASGADRPPQRFFGRRSNVPRVGAIHEPCGLFMCTFESQNVTAVIGRNFSSGLSERDFSLGRLGQVVLSVH